MAEWKEENLGSLLELIQNGYSGKQDDEKGNYPISRIETLQEDDIDVNRIKYADLSKDEFKKFAYENGDLIFSHINSFEKVGKVALYQGQIKNLVHGVNLLRFRFNNKIIPEYAFYYFNSSICRAELEPLIKRAINQASINQKNLKTIAFPHPDVSEQKRIVSKLDALFDRIDKAIVLLEENILSSEELTGSVLDSFFAKLKKKYNEVPLLKHVKFKGGSQPPKSEFKYESKPGYVRLIQIRDYKSDDHLTYIPKNSTKKFCEPEDVMIGRYGPPVFQILRGLEGAYNVALMKAIPDTKYITKDYLFYFLQNREIQDYIISISQRSAGQSGVNKKALEAYDIILPPIEVQKKVVVEIENTLPKVEQFLKIGKNNLKYLKSLKKSLLDQAFKGELV